jgi:hypothetical protein
MAPNNANLLLLAQPAEHDAIHADAHHGEHVQDADLRIRALQVEVSHRRSVSVPPQGITTPVSSAVIMAMAGPRKKSLRLAMAGMKSSFMNIFSRRPPAATGRRALRGWGRCGPA